MATLVDISKQVALSPASVSKILSGRPGFNSHTRMRVMEAARRLKYQPNVAARGLLQNKSFLLGIMDRQCNDWMLANYLKGVQAVSIPRHYAPLVFSHESPQEQDKNLVLCQGRKVDGLLATIHVHPDDSPHLGKLAELADSGFPIVETQGRCLPETPSVLFDYRQGGRLAVEHLASLGHRQIALFPEEEGAGASKPNLFWYRQEYVKGCLEAIRERDLEPAVLLDPIHIERPQTLLQWQSAASQAADQILARRPDATAIVCMGKVEAVAMINALRSRNIHVPGGMSIIACEIDPPMPLVPKTITTVNYSARQAGVQATTMLFARMNGQAVEDAFIAPRLGLGQTTAAPGAKQRELDVGN